jgi:hypothetical protein
MYLLSANDFANQRIIYTGVFIGLLLVFVAYMGDQLDRKKHFAFTYSNFGVHTFMIACLAGLMSTGLGNSYEPDSSYMLWFLLLAGATAFFYVQALKKRSFYFLLIVALYGYIGLSYVVVRLLIAADSIGAFYAGLLYFIGSGIGAVIFLINTNKRLKKA